MHFQRLLGVKFHYSDMDFSNINRRPIASFQRINVERPQSLSTADISDVTSSHSTIICCQHQTQSASSVTIMSHSAVLHSTYFSQNILVSLQWRRQTRGVGCVRTPSRKCIIFLM